MTNKELSNIKGHQVSDKYFELFEKVSDISNSEFPLVDFLNDIEDREYKNDSTYNYARAYEDIEKIYNTFVCYLTRERN